MHNYKNDNKDPGSLSDNLIRNMKLDSKGNIWIATNKGLNLFQKDTDTFKKYYHDINNLDSLSSNDVRKIFEDSEGNIWIGTEGKGVIVYDGSKIVNQYTSKDGLMSDYISLLIVSLVAIGKEVYDSYNQDKHTPEYLDVYATVLPALIVYLILLK